jgi:hypothetical protein
MQLAPLHVGGGKKTRAKYDPDMMKHLSMALSAAGLTEDRGASACAECQGMYKYQHDTDKDLKYLHVFPNVDLIPEGGGDEGGGGGGGGGPQSPEYQVGMYKLNAVDPQLEKPRFNH